MAYDEALADRLRQIFHERRDVSERQMFGGIAFMVRGHMCCGIVGSDLMLRVGNDRFDAAIGRTRARPMDFTGRPLRGMLYVAPAGFTTHTALASWVRDALAFVLTLPEKPAAKSAPKRTRKGASRGGHGSNGRT